MLYKEMKIIFVKKEKLEGVEDAGKGVSNIQLYRRIESNNK